MTHYFVLFIFFELNDLCGLNTIHEENKVFRYFSDVLLEVFIHRWYVPKRYIHFAEDLFKINNIKEYLPKIWHQWPETFRVRGISLIFHHTCLS